MKFFTLKSITVFATLALSTNAFAMDVKFNDAVWDGKKIPEGQQCLNYGGKSPATPSMTVSNIPAGAESLVFVYNEPPRLYRRLFIQVKQQCLTD